MGPASVNIFAGDHGGPVAPQICPLLCKMNQQRSRRMSKIWLDAVKEAGFEQAAIEADIGQSVPARPSAALMADRPDFFPSPEICGRNDFHSIDIGRETC